MKKPEAKIMHLPTSLIPEAKTRFEAGEVVLGTLVDVDSTGKPWIDYAGNPASDAISALTTTSLHEQNIGRQVALLFAEGNPAKPVVMGLIRNIFDKESANESDLTRPKGNQERDKSVEAFVEQTGPIEALIDGERIVFSADKEIVLQCGKASITLTNSGKVLIRGTYLSSRSSGANRIKGGSVQIN